MVWERIEQKSREREEARRQAEQERNTREREQVQRQNEETAARARELAAKRELAQRLISESRIVESLGQIKNRIVTSGRKDIVVDLDSVASGRASVTLAWGRYHLNHQGKIDYSSFTRVQDYSYIEVEFDLRDESMKINYSRFPKEQWTTQYNTVLDALADAYLNPKHYQASERSYISGGSSTPECCHS